jgi:hypothetical protein
MSEYRYVHLFKWSLVFEMRTHDCTYLLRFERQFHLTRHHMKCQGVPRELPRKAALGHLNVQYISVTICNRYSITHHTNYTIPHTTNYKQAGGSQLQLALFREYTTPDILITYCFHDWCTVKNIRNYIAPYLNRVSVICNTVSFLLWRYYKQWDLL